MIHSFTHYRQKICSYLSSLPLKHNERVRNLGNILDSDLRFNKNINKVSKNCFSYVRKVRGFLSQREIGPCFHRN